MNVVDVLLTGWVRETAPGTFDTGGTVTLIRSTVNILVDTGDVSQQSALLEALRQRDLRTDDIAYVVNTHGHLDHIGGNALFPGATFILGDDIAHNGEYRSHEFGKSPMLLPETDDGKIVIFAAPGHTDHDRCVFVRTDRDTVVAIAGDLFEYEGDDAPDVWRRWSRDPDRQQKIRDGIRVIAQRVVPGHGGMFDLKPPGPMR